MALAAGDRKQVDKTPVRRHHRVVPDAQRVDVLDDLFLLRIEHLPVTGVRRLIQEPAVRRDGAVLRFGAKADVERLDDFVLDRVDQCHDASDLGAT